MDHFIDFSEISAHPPTRMFFTITTRAPQGLLLSGLPSCPVPLVQGHKTLGRDLQGLAYSSLRGALRIWWRSDRCLCHQEIHHPGLLLLYKAIPQKKTLKLV